jgi:hypothetical protein
MPHMPESARTPASAAPTRRRRLLLVVAAAIAATVLSAVGLLATAPPASAATQGSGFGAWAPLSTHGWHGSMVAGGVHTYCILPGLPAPTGDSVDHGVLGDAGGLSPQQLVGINRLVTTYGQTADPVQAAAVGWAVKAIADRHTTLHAWGYPGDDLAGAVHWSFDRFVPEHAAAVAALAEQYYAEAVATPIPGADGAVALTTDPDDPRRGTVRLTGGAGTTASIALANAVFADTGAAELASAPSDTDLPITVTESTDGRPVTVRATARLVAAFAPAVRFFTTPGQQNTAGPGGGVEYVAEATDAAPRPVVFSPGITTQVAAPETAAGPYIDDVTIAPVTGVWPRTADDAFVSLRATAVVYRTEEPPAASPDVPADATPVGELELTTDPATGGGTYRVTSTWELPGPGSYTAVWRIAAADQLPEVAAHLEQDYAWSEQFAAPTQITRVPPPPVAPPAPATATPQLAETGARDGLPRVAGWAVVALILGAAFLGHHAQRRRRAAIRA